MESCTFSKYHAVLVKLKLLANTVNYWPILNLANGSEPYLLRGLNFERFWHGRLISVNVIHISIMGGSPQDTGNFPATKPKNPQSCHNQWESFGDHGKITSCNQSDLR
jgi:hypothetical protein